jgi:exonuclease SbcC
MTKLYFIGDTHFGRKYSYLQDYELNISKRNLDVIDNCEKIIEDAISNHADHVIFLGDVYDRKIISPTIRKIVRKRIFDPLLKANIPVLIIGGNHDSSRNPRRGVDLEDLTSYPNVEVVTDYSGKIIESKGKKIGILCLPFIHYEILLALAQKKGYLITEKDQTHSVAQTIVETYVSNMCENDLKDCDHRILIGHYYLKGSKFRETSNPSTIYGEFQLNEQMIQKKYFDLVMFGHVHLKQTLYNDDRIVVLGSSDRIHMGERDSQKYYAIYEPEEDKLEYKEIICRTLLKVEIQIPKTTKEITKYLIEKLPEQNIVKDAVCQIIVKYTKDKHLHIDKNAIDEYLSGSFYTTINYIEQSEEDIQHLREANLAPTSLFKDFLTQKYHDDEYFPDLLSVGSELIEAQLKTSNVTEKGALSIRSIDVQFFNKYGKGPNKITFDKGQYVITGPTGTGKSSLLDAITFALFKRSIRRDVGLTIDEILYEDGYVELELRIGENILIIKRKQKSPKLQITINDKKPFQGMSIPEKEIKLEEIVGYDYEGFISSFFIRQQELQIFSSLSSAERQKRLAKLFKLKIFQSLEKNLKDKIDEAEKAYNNLEGAISSDNERVAKLPEIKAEFKKAKDGLKQITLYISSQAKVVKAAKEDLESMNDKIIEYNTLTHKIEELEKSLADNQQNLKEYQKKQEKYQKIKEELKDFKDLSKELTELQKTKDKLKEQRSKKALIESQIEKEEQGKIQTEKHFNTGITKSKTKIRNLQDRLKALSSAMTKEQAFGLLKKIGTLSERISRIQTIEIPMAKEYSDNERLDQFEKEIEETENVREEIEVQEDEITEDIFIADDLIVQINELEQEIMNLEENKTVELEQFEAKKQSHQNQIKSQNLNINFDEKLKPIEEKLKSLKLEQDKKEKLEKDLANLQDFTALIQKTVSDNEKTKQTLNETKKTKQKLDPIYREYQTKQNQLIHDENELNDFIATKEGVKVRVEMLKTNIEELKDLKKKIEADKKILDKMKRDIDVHVILRKKIFHLEGIPKFALEKILPAISIRASSILSDLTDGRLSKIAFIPLENNRIGFDIHVDDGESTREASTFSGGEKTQINAAIRFAIMERIEEIPDTTGAIFRKSDTLFIDEGDLGTLDDDSSRQLFVNKIMEMGSRFKNIILITHLEDVAEQFPNRIKIGRGKDGKSEVIK